MVGVLDAPGVAPGRLDFHSNSRCMGWIPTVARFGMRELNAACVKITRQQIEGVMTTLGLGTTPGGMVCPPQWHFLCCQIIQRNLLVAKPKQVIGATDTRQQ